MILNLDNISLRELLGITSPFEFDPDLIPKPGYLKLKHFLNENFIFLMSEIKEEPKFHGKQWQYFQIMSQALTIKSSRRRSALGFGVGLEAIPAFLAKNDFKVLATDYLDGEDASGWNSTGQLFTDINKLNDRAICDPEKFHNLCSFMNVDMNNLNIFGREKFDFIWSTCALGHIGGYQQGLDFVLKSANLLNKGGIAVHTTEIDLSNLDSFNTPGLSLYKIESIIKLLDDLKLLKRIKVSNHDFRLGTSPLEVHLDKPPYGKFHLKLEVFDRPVVPFSIIFSKK